MMVGYYVIISKVVSIFVLSFFRRNCDTLECAGFFINQKRQKKIIYNDRENDDIKYKWKKILLYTNLAYQLHVHFTIKDSIPYIFLIWILLNT